VQVVQVSRLVYEQYPKYEEVKFRQRKPVQPGYSALDAIYGARMLEYEGGRERT
jgi:hypothetical protein